MSERRVKLCSLVFVNSDATPKVTEITCAYQSVAPIMEWYGAFHSGDRYYVTLNGKKLKIEEFLRAVNETENRT